MVPPSVQRLWPPKKPKVVIFICHYKPSQKPTQKRSPPYILVDEHFKEAFNPPAADY
jgi:hypothetical protein